MGWGSEIFVLI